MKWSDKGSTSVIECRLEMLEKIGQCKVHKHGRHISALIDAWALMLSKNVFL